VVPVGQFYDLSNDARRVHAVSDPYLTGRSTLGRQQGPHRPPSLDLLATQTSVAFG
jgi:hypothetical protein